MDNRTLKIPLEAVNLPFGYGQILVRLCLAIRSSSTRVNGKLNVCSCKLRFESLLGQNQGICKSKKDQKHHFFGTLSTHFNVPHLESPLIFSTVSRGSDMPKIMIWCFLSIILSSGARFAVKMPIFITKFPLWATVLNSTGIFFGQSLCITKFWRSWLARVGCNYRGSFSLNPIWFQIRGLGTGTFAGLLVFFFVVLLGSTSSQLFISHSILSRH